MAGDIWPGQSYPLGATVMRGGTNFSIYAKGAMALDLLLFDDPEAPQPCRIIPLDRQRHNTFHYWHAFVPNVGHGQVYAYRTYGSHAPERGLRFDDSKVLLDPYARAVVGDELYSRKAASNPGDNTARSLRGVVIDPNRYDWQGDTAPRIPYSRTVIYEMHVGGFTAHPSSDLPEDLRGTYAGTIAKIPYLKSLGVTAVELLPIHHFDTQDAPPGVSNYWGYSSIAFFAPHRGYSSRRDPVGPVDEFRDMVKAFHRAGIEVILDVVFNHTAEGDRNGPTLSFRGLDNETYYILDPDDASEYANYTGCGNTVKANHPVVGRTILDSLRYWVTEMHVDGFRFDLASVLSRDIFGAPPEAPVPVLWDIESAPMLAGTKLIVEAWDAAGLYQVGQFVNYSDWYAEWNGPFRDDMRRFIKGDRGTVGSLAARILGSPDIYTGSDRDANRSIHFITCHDGFTLNDLVSYDYKHNEANGEDNRDGTDANYSWNCGVEGPSANPEIEGLRLRQMKNLMLVLLLSQGTPMLSMGDEVRRTQLGNNNAYCQNNELSWFDWTYVDKHRDFLSFSQHAIALIQALELFQQEQPLSIGYSDRHPYLQWHGVELDNPDWDESSHTLAFEIGHPERGEHLYVALNAYWEKLQFQLPFLSAEELWHRMVDTALPAPEDFSSYRLAPAIENKFYAVEARSAIVLITKSG
ncbi:MAG: glycogen debranching protein GlgX [Cyanobacteria bacterium P01_F01_bin.33]